MTHQSLDSARRKRDLLGPVLEEILLAIKPAAADTWQRDYTINQLSAIIRSIPVQHLSSANVTSFGSFASDLYTKWGDLDISVELSTSPNTSTNIYQRRKLLQTILRALQRKGFGHTYQYIPMAKVPVLMFKCGHPTISCDISIDNYEGHIKSKFFLWLTQMDGRFRDLVLLIKEWAKAHDINNPKSGTLNSFSLCLLIIYHLQTCQPAILPPLRQIYNGKLVSDSDANSIFMIPERRIEEQCRVAIRNFRTQNKDTLAQLFFSFFQKFSGIGNWASWYVIDTFNAKREAANSRPEWFEKSYELKVEDPFEKTNNVANNAARTVSAEGLIKISRAFALTFEKLSTLSSDRERLLQCLLRPDILRHLDNRFTSAPSQDENRYYNAGTTYSSPYFQATIQPSSSASSSRSYRQQPGFY